MTDLEPNINAVPMRSSVKMNGYKAGQFCVRNATALRLSRRTRVFAQFHGRRLGDLAAGAGATGLLCRTP